MSRRDREEKEILKHLFNNPEVKLFVHPPVAEDIQSLLGVNLPEGVKERLRPIDSGDECDLVICQKVDLDNPIYFEDNIITVCSECDCDIQHRLHAPSKPPKICVSCAVKKVKENNGEYDK